MIAALAYRITITSCVVELALCAFILAGAHAWPTRLFLLGAASWTAALLYRLLNPPLEGDAA